MGTFASTTVPGCRVPHVWVEVRRSLYDRENRSRRLHSLTGRCYRSPSVRLIRAAPGYSVLAGDYAHGLIRRDTLAAIAVRMNNQLYARLSDIPTENCPVWI